MGKSEGNTRRSWYPLQKCSRLWLHRFLAPILRGGQGCILHIAKVVIGQRAQGSPGCMCMGAVPHNQNLVPLTYAQGRQCIDAFGIGWPAPRGDVLHGDVDVWETVRYLYKAC